MLMADRRECCTALMKVKASVDAGTCYSAYPAGIGARAGLSFYCDIYTTKDSDES